MSTYHATKKPYTQSQGPLQKGHLNIYNFTKGKKKFPACSDRNRLRKQEKQILNSLHTLVCTDTFFIFIALGSRIIKMPHFIWDWANDQKTNVTSQSDQKRARPISFQHRCDWCWIGKQETGHGRIIGWLLSVQNPITTDLTNGPMVVVQKCILPKPNPSRHLPLLAHPTLAPLYNPSFSL